MSYVFNILPEPPELDQGAIPEQPSQTAYDTVWAQSEIPVRQPEGLERVMLSEDKLFVVLAVVLIIWLGIAAMIIRTDRRLARLETSLHESPDERATLH